MLLFGFHLFSLAYHSELLVRISLCFVGLSRHFVVYCKTIIVNFKLLRQYQ